MKNYYQILGVDKTSSRGKIISAFRTLANKYHPDKNAEEDAKEKFYLIERAYKTLLDPVKKQEYDSQEKASMTDEPIEFGLEVWKELLKKV